jgi:sugar phosphate isomerase/epimerase
MQLGFVSAILPERSLEQVVDFAQKTGYDTIELMCWPVGKAQRRYAGVTHVDVVDLDSVAADSVRKTFESAGVSISGLGYYPNPLSPDAAEANLASEHIRRVIRAAALVGVGRMNTFVGRDWRLSVEENWPRFLEVWRPLIACAEEHQVKVGIENCPMFFTRDEWPAGKNLAISPAIWRRMFADIPSDYFGLNYDPSHMVWQQMDYLAPMKEFAAKLFHIHAKDVRLDRDRLNRVGILAHPSEYHTPKLPGMGEVDWGRFFSILTDSGYNGPVCVEVEDRAYEGSLENRQASLTQSHTFLRNFIPKRRDP